MKKLGLLIIFAIVFNMGFAQQADQIQRGQRGYVPPMVFNNSTFIELVDPYDEVDKMIPICAKEFKLDAFEQEVIKGMLIEKFESQNAILEDEKNTRTDRKKKIDDLDKELYKELATILNPDEIEKFKVLDFTETSKEKKKRKKKGRKN